jgi:drug/metabolite transporter (DMT)-like permease
MGEPLSRKGLLNLLVVYTVWSTTYLAMRVAVDPGNGAPPFVFGAARMLVAALILLALARLQKQSVTPTKSELFALFTVGNLLWLGGNGLVLWAEQYVESGFTCLLVSATPIWATIIELILYKKRPSGLLVLSLLVGFLGVAVLCIPTFRGDFANDTFAVIALLLSSVCWSLGSVLQSRLPVSLSPQAMSGYHQLAAFIGFALVSLALGEPAPRPAAAAVYAWLYLVIFGSVFAFTSYIFALRLLPINIAMTYAYVNPVLALFLGWLLLDESIGLWTLLGAFLVIVSVVGIFRVKHRAAGQPAGPGRAKATAEPESVSPS